MAAGAIVKNSDSARRLRASLTGVSKPADKTLEDWMKRLDTNDAAAQQTGVLGSRPWQRRLPRCASGPRDARRWRRSFYGWDIAQDSRCYVTAKLRAR